MVNPDMVQKNAPNVSVQVATAGEALIDLIAQADGSFVPCLGGSVFNVTRALARQGVGTLYLNPLSFDRFGGQLRQALLDDGVHLAHPVPVPQTTSLAVVSVTATGQPDYAFYRQGVADRAVNAASLVNACESQSDLRIVYTGCLALSPDDAAVYLPWLQQCRAAGQTVVVDINLRPSVMPDLPAYRANIWAALQHAHIAKASDEDLAILAVPGDTPLAQARYVLAHSSADIMLLTLGADGACLLTRDGKAWVARESKPVCVVDTVGAGDCFLAGFVAAWLRLQQGQIEENAPLLLAHGLASASLCVMQQGCVPPDQAQVSERVAEVGRVFERLSD